MNFSRPVLKIIDERRSFRSFTDEPLDESRGVDLLAFVAALPRPPFGSSVKITLLRAFDAAARGIKLGTYGVIKGARNFLVGAVADDSTDALIDFGFLFESAVLKATDLGLGTCWLGGTFSRSAFAEAVQLDPGQVIPAVSPVGVPLERRSLVDRAFRAFAGSDGRKPFGELFFNGDFDLPLTEAKAGPFGPILLGVRRAPSASNKQPWRIVRESDGTAFHFFLKRSVGYRRLPVDLQVVDMGIAMSHFDLAAREANHAGRWERLSVRVPAGSLEYMASWVAS